MLLKESLLEKYESLQSRIIEKDDFDLYEESENFKKELEEYLSYVNTLEDEIEDIKRKNVVLEQKIKEIQDKIDSVATKSGKSYCDYEVVCEKKYKKIWHLLSSESKEYLIIAHYLFYVLSGECADFAPVIIESCRVFENELKIKIFAEYIEKKKDEAELLPSGYDDSLYYAIKSLKK